MTGQQLKNSILQLAIQGKLVPQIESEGTAEDLLKEIRAEKEKLVKEGKLKKKDLDVKPIEEDEVPFEIPEGWRWCRLGEILDVRDGTHDSPKYVIDGFPLLTSKNLRNGQVDFTSALFISEEDFKKINTRSCVDDDDILFAMIGSIGNPVLVKKEKDFAIKNMALFKKVNNGSDMKYIYYYLLNEQYAMRDFASGGVQSFVSLSYLRNYGVPLPPLSEQKRIVSKIEELMPLVEEYGKAQERLEALNKELPEKLKKSVLQEAIMGKLVPQDPKEGTAEELLAEIRKEKEKLVKEGKLKKKDLEEKPIEDDEIPFEIPEGWKWVRIGEFADIINGFTPLRTNAEFWTNGTVSWFTVDDIRDQGRRIKSTKQYINEKALAKNTSRILPKHTLLICCTASVGEYALTEIPLTTNQQFNGIVIKNEYINLISPEYLFSIAPTFKNRLLDLAGKTTFNFVSVKKVSEMIIPLPPLAEQKRIVAKVEEVMGEIEGMKI